VKLKPKKKVGQITEAGKFYLERTFIGSVKNKYVINAGPTSNWQVTMKKDIHVVWQKASITF
jgi:hypothetical protein